MYTGVRCIGKERVYDILETLEFSSDRKRMSIIVRTSHGIQLFCKGADNIVLGLLSQTDNDPSVIRSFEQAIEAYAKEGLRTLALAHRTLTEDAYKEFKFIYGQAEKSLVDREEKVAKACEVIERELVLLGGTAIEDKLQDDVPDTIAYLLKVRAVLCTV